jgi:hypothetical protein
LFTKIPAERHECWSRLAAFVAFWHRIDCPLIDDGQTVAQGANLDVTIPVAWIEWHSRFGRVINQTCERAFTLPIDKLRVEGGKLIVRSEAVFDGMLEAKWGIPLAQLDADDPPVVSVLGEREHPCAKTLSQFAIYCAVFDTINSHHTKQIDCDNESPFPANGKQMEFPHSFGVIRTEMYEGKNWLALVSGTDWYLRRRNVQTDTDEFVKHEVRATELEN